MLGGVGGARVSRPLSRSFGYHDVKACATVHPTIFATTSLNAILWMPLMLHENMLHCNYVNENLAGGSRMSPVIRISDELFARLESHAKGFDSPSNVIERILNSFEGEEAETYSNQISEGRDRTKYEFGDDVYGKARLVWEVVKQYVSDNRDVKVSDLSDAFPKELQGTHGVLSLIHI